MTYDGLKFILDENTVLSIIFTSTGKAFHIGGPNLYITGSIITITGLSVESALKCYHSIHNIDDLMDQILFIGLEALESTF